MPQLRLMAPLALDGEPWPIARLPARPESAILPLIRDRGTPALPIPTVYSRTEQTDFCINARRQTPGHFITLPTPTHIL